MRSDRYKTETELDISEVSEAAHAAADEEYDADEDLQEEGRRRRLFGRRKSADREVKLTEDSEPVDLSRLKKKDLLEIMLRQGEEIDALRARVAELEAELENKEFMIDRVGSIAEASLAVTDIFKEAEKAARIYLENIRSRVK